jgi:hypothetical protein
MPRFPNTLTVNTICAFSLLYSSLEYAHAATDKAGYLGIAPMATSMKFSSEGLSTINNRLGNSVVLSVPKSHGSGMSFGGRALHFNKEFQLFRNLTFEALQDNIHSKGTGGEISSNLSLINATGSVEWRIFPRTPLNITQMAQRSLVRRAYISAGPLLGVSSLSYDYSLISRLNSSEIRYKSNSLLAALGAQTTLGIALFPTVHAGIGVRAIQSVPVSTQTSITHFTLEGQDLRYKGDELGVEKLTNSKLTQISAFGTLGLLL